MKNFVPLESFISLPQSKQIHMLSMRYIQMCTEESGKKFMSILMPIKKFLGKQELSSLFILYDYLMSLQEKTVMDLGTCFREARKYEEKLRIANDKQLQPEVMPYGSYESYLKKLMETKF